jgi:hypothetical protein
MQQCGYCGNTILVPPYLFSEDRTNTSTGRPDSHELNDLTNKALVLGKIKKLLAEGKKIDAVKVYRESFGTSLADAKEAVEKLERGEPLVFESLSLNSVLEPLSKTKIDVAGAKRVGAYFAAIAALIIISALILAVVVAGSLFKTGTPSAPEAAGADVEAAGDGSSGELLRIGGKGKGIGQFEDNRVVAVDEKGNIFSVDYKGGRIQIFDKDGNFTRQWNAKGIDLVFAIGADRHGNLFVLSNKGIRKYSALDGEEMAGFNDPWLRDMHVNPDGSVIAVTRDAIIFLSKDLSVTKRVGDAAESASASGGFASVVADGAGMMYLLDRKGEDIIKISSDGKFLNRFPVELRSPNDIAVHPGGNIYVTETSRILVFSPTGKQLAEMPAEQAFGITFNDIGEMFVASRPFVVKRSSFEQADR